MFSSIGRERRIVHMGEMMPNWLLQREYLTPERTALIYKDQQWTFRQLADDVKKLHSHLPVEKNERVAVLIDNTPQSVILIHALQLSGAETVFLNHKLSDQELAYIISDSEVIKLFYMNRFEEKAQVCQKGVKVRVESIFDCEPINGKQQTEFDLHNTCSIMYTSGTTGRPKGVMQTYGNHWWSANASVLNVGLMSNDCWLCTVPIFHISGLSILFRSVIYGIPVYLMDKFDEVEVNRLLQGGKVTMMSAVATMVTRMVDQLGTKSYHKNFRCLLLGGSSAYASLLTRCKEKSIPVFQTYGMTETASQVVTLSPEYSLEKLGSAGKPLFPNQIKIMEPDENEIGEIWIKGPTMTKGYLHNRASDSFVDGWFRSGDLGYLDADGFLYIVDRRSDLIVSGGENIYPAEIESILLEHPAIMEAGVTGIEDPLWGKVPFAFIVAKTRLQEKDIQTFCEQRLAKYKVPKRFIHVDELPKNASNKIVRRELEKFVQ